MTRLKRIFLITILSIAGLFLLVSLLAYIYKDKVQKIVVQAINQNLTAKIDVEEISFSLLRHFPYASIEFKNLKAHEATNFTTTGTVLTASSLSLLFNFTSIFSDSYVLKKIVLRDAALNLQIDKDGNLNYEIWKKDGNTKGNFNIELKDVQLENIDVLYYNAARQQDFSFLITNGSLKGDFNNTLYALEGNASLLKTTIKIDSVTYLSNKNCDVQLLLDIDKNNKTYTFKNSVLKLEGLSFGVDGIIAETSENLEYNLKINSPGADIPSLLSLIPKKYLSSTNGYNYSGNIEFNGSVKGKSDKHNSPLVAFNFKGTNINLNPKNTPYHLKQLNCSGYFTNRKNNSSPVTYLRLEKFSGLLEGKKIDAGIEIENFSRPRLNVKVAMDADLAALSRFFKPDTIQEISGIIKIDAIFKGIAGEKSTYYSAGSVSLSNVAFRLKQKPVNFKNFNGLIHLDGNNLHIDKLSGNAGNSDFSISGSFNNLFSWLLTDNQKLDIVASVNSESVDLDELMAKDLKASTISDTVYRMNFSDKFRLQLELSVNKLSFKKFSASEMHGLLALENKILTTKALDFETAGGEIKLKGSIDDRPADSLKINYDAIITDVNINKLFTEMGNFGQKALQDKNLKGTVSALVQFRSTWSDRLQVDENSIYSKCEIDINNGELVNFEPMMALSRFLKGADLNTVKFSKLSNTIEIKNRKIYIPIMEIKSSALDLTVSGEHTFDNIVDYKLRLYLSQLLGKKIKEQNTEFGTIEDDGLGRPMVYILMKGPVENPKFTMDRKGVEQKITTEIKNETKTLKSLLKDEFGKPEPANNKKSDPKKKEELQIEIDD